MVAFDALVRFEQDPTVFVGEIFDTHATEADLDSRERRFGNEIVLGVVRRRITLDCVIAAFCRGPIHSLESQALVALRIGTYQLLFLEGVPPFAAISETVDLVRRCHEGVRSTVNAILRAIDRESRRIDPERDRGGSSGSKRLEVSDRRIIYFSRDVFCDPKESEALYLAQTHGHPVFLVSRWLESFTREEVEAVLVADNSRPRTTARIDPKRTSRDAVLKRLQAENVLCGEGSREDSIEFGAPLGEVIASRTFLDGGFYLQDETAMKVAPALDPQPGERILDLCAAPGGKTTHLAELAGDRAILVAVDRDASRLERVRENAARLKLTSISTLCCDVLDESQPLPPELDAKFDAILLDVPCSNSGVLARRVEARHRIHPQAILDLAEQGRRLYAFAVRHLSPGGRIVYSTCSLEREENQENVTRCIVATPGAVLEREERTLPSAGRGDGGYFAVIRVGTK